MRTRDWEYYLIMFIYQANYSDNQYLAVLDKDRLSHLPMNRVWSICKIKLHAPGGQSTRPDCRLHRYQTALVIEPSVATRRIAILYGLRFLEIHCPKNRKEKKYEPLRQRV